ncbi:MAG: protein FdrA [marine bacterium B5-7]|nr:MAG: protein FdrA [marine bacterium B5-7]
MLSRIELRRGVYHDSVVLMRVTSQLSQMDGLDGCLVAMATPLNIGLLGDLGFDVEQIDSASTSDLVVAIRAESDDIMEEAFKQLDSELASSRDTATGAGDTPVHHLLGNAVRDSNANLAIISLPGPHVVPETVDALLEGANVMVFSDGVTMDEERRLKALAAERDLLVLGPDCGTARLCGIALGFCNDLGQGGVGIIAASGTGAQHLTCLLDARNVGIGDIIGVGGRDMTDEIGGASTLRALEMLDADQNTTHIVVISKQPGPEATRKLEQVVANLKTPVTFALLGNKETDLTKVAREVTAACNMTFSEPRIEISGRAASGGQLVGLFSGGTLAGEATTIINASIDSVANLETFETPTPMTIASFDQHLLVDLGDDRMTVGRAHPMIDATVRREIIQILAERPAPRVLFIDIVLGFGADPDPVGAIRSSLEKFIASHEETRVVVSFVGTSRDPQGYEAQWRKLAEIGCDVYESNANAATAVAALIKQ